MKILVLQLKRIGDLILSTPALAALRAWPGGTHVTVAVHPGTAALLPALPQVDSGIVVGTGRGWTPWQQTMTGHFDTVIDLTGSDRSALLALLTRARRRMAFANLRRSRFRALAFNEFIEAPVRNLHTADYYLASTGLTGPGEPVLRLPSDAPLPVRGEYILIHPGSARREKYWTVQAWTEVIRHANERGLQCVMTGGTEEFETEHLRAIQQATGITNLAGRMSLLELAQTVAGARLVLSVDTSVVHFAAAFRRPQIALFGPTNPFQWRPRHLAAVVFSATQPEAPLNEFHPRLRGAPMEQLSTAAVIRATDALLSSTHA